jgi:hypothetical protein
MISGSVLYRNRQNKSFENIAEFRYLGTMVVNGIYIHSEVQRRINLQTVRFNLVAIFLSLSRNMKIKIWKPIILLVTYHCEALFVTLE